MKKTISVLLTLFMLLTGVISAQAATGDAVLIAAPADENERMDSRLGSMASDGNTLYVISGDQVLTCTKDDPTMKPYISGITHDRNYYNMEEPDMDHIIGHIFVKDGGLLCLDDRQGTLFTVSPDAEGKPVYGEVKQLIMDEELFEEYDGRRQLSNFQFEQSVLAGNTLLATGYNWESGSGYKELYRIDMESGEMEPVEDVGTAEVIGSYKDGKALIMNVDYDNMYDEETQSYKPWPLSVYDPATNEIEELARIDVKGLNYYNVRGFAYDEAGDRIYIVVDNRIYLLNDQQGADLVAYHPSSSMYSSNVPTLALGGYIVVRDDNTGAMYLRNPDPAQLPKHTLAISNYYDSEAHTKAAALMDDVPIFFENSSYYSTAQELGQALAAGESQIDLLAVSLSWMDFDRLVNKGYCYDLSGSSKLMEYINKLYPAIRDTVMYDGKLMGIPVETYTGNFWSYNVEAFEKLGYQVPASYAEMVDLMNTFASAENEELWEEYCLISDEGSIKDMLMNSVLNQYEQYMLSMGKTLSLDTPEFRSAMEAIERLDVENVEVHGGWDEDGEPSEEMQALWNKTALFNNWSDLSVYNRGRAEYEPLRLVIGEDAGFQIFMDEQILFVNPRSENLDEAVRYLENLTASFSQVDLTAWSPEYNDPIENPYYERNIKEMQKELERQEKLIQEAEPLDRQALQQELDDYKEYVVRYEQENRYNVSEQSIAWYRDLAQYIVISRPSVMYSSNNDDSFYTLRSRYTDGQINLEQFIREGSSKLRLMQMENQ